MKANPSLRRKRFFVLAVAAFAVSLLCLGCRPGPPTQGPHATLDAYSAYTPYQRQRSDWPTQAWKTVNPNEVGMDATLLQKAADYAFKRTGDEKDRKGLRTDGLLIVRQGRIVFERYARQFKQDTPHLTWSVSKSVVNTLYGIAEKQGILKRNDLASRYMPQLKQGSKAKLTVTHLLRMSSGLFWDEGYEASPLKSEAIKMLYTAGRDDMGGYAATRHHRYLPDTHWYYSSGTSNILMAMLRNKLGSNQAVTEFIWKQLFAKLGIKSAVWERDASGTFVGSSYLYATPRDMARIGYLYLNDGIWEGKRLLPKDWVKFTASAAPADKKGHYGAHWWLNAGRPSKGIASRWPAAPADTFSASGHWGQYIIVIPSLDLVIVRTGDDRSTRFNRNTLLKLVIAALKNPSQRTIPRMAVPKTRTVNASVNGGRAAPPVMRKDKQPNAPRPRGGQ